MAKSYKTECPSCGRLTFYVTPHNSLGYCFSASCHYYERGDNKNTKQRVRSKYINDIRAYYERMADYYHTCLNKEALKFLYNRGLTDTTIQELKIGFCPGGKSYFYNGLIAKEAGLSSYNGEAFLANRITFPYFANNTVTDIRGRALSNNDDIKYKSPWQDYYYRGADYPYNYRYYSEKCIIITEGEIKSILASQAGFPTMGLPGMTVWRNGFHQRDEQTPIICFDSQKKNNYDVIMAIIRCAGFLDNVKVATLPLMGREKMDIDTFIIDYGTDLFKAVIQSALNYNDWLRLQRY